MDNFSNASRIFKAKFSEFVEDVFRNMNGPDRKCPAALLWGILKGGNVNIADMARALEEGCSLDVTEIRLTRFLKRFEATLLDDRIAERVKACLSRPYLFVLDESDVSRPSARKMEGLCRVIDASKGRDVVANGYHVTGIGAIGGTRRIIMAVRLGIWSTEEKGFVSMNARTEETLSEVFGVFGDGCGAIDMDRGYDSAEIMNFIDKYGISYVIRCMDLRKYRVGQERLSISELGASRKGRYVQCFRDADTRVTIHPKCTGFRVAHDDIRHDAMLVWEWFGDGDVRFYITNDVDLGREGVIRAPRRYRKRWRIENFSKFIKQLFGFERFLVRSLGAMRGICRLLALATNLIDEIAMERGTLCRLCKKAYPKFRAQERAEEIEALYGVYGLEFYQLKKGLQIIAGHAGRRPEIMRRKRRKRAPQMTIEECLEEQKSAPKC